MIIFHANGKRLQLAHENEEFFIFKNKSTYICQKCRILFERKKNVLWDPFNLKVYLVGDFFCLAWIGSATMLPTQI